MAVAQGMEVKFCRHCSKEGIAPISQINWWCGDCDRQLFLRKNGYYAKKK